MCMRLTKIKMVTDKGLKYMSRDVRDITKHAYSNISKISPPKTENLQIKKISEFFQISAQNIDCGLREAVLMSGYTLEPPW